MAQEICHVQICSILLPVEIKYNLGDTKQPTDVPHCLVYANANVVMKNEKYYCTQSTLSKVLELLLLFLQYR